MPGFIAGWAQSEVGVSMPAGPVYTYTWQILQMAGLRIPETIYLKECTLPDWTADIEEYQAPHVKYKYAKGVTFNDVKFNFYDTRGLAVELDKLKRQVWTPETGIAPASDYKRDSRISVFEGDDFKQEQSWLLNGSWIKGISWAMLTYANSDMHSVSVTLAYDWAILEY